MTTAFAKRISDLLAAAPVLDADGAENLRESSRLLANALDCEDHGAIAEHDRELEFVVQGAVVELGEVALKAGDGETAALMIEWGKAAIPKGERDELIELLLVAGRAAR